MKNTIYDIPVKEALENPGNCAFCAMHDGLAAGTIHTLAGPSVAYMEEDVRAATNKAGFCAAHLKALYDGKNRLGLALMLHTHVMEVNGKLEKLYQNEGGKAKLFAKGTSDVAEYLQNLAETCYVCDIVEASFARYLDTFFALFAKEDNVRQLVAAQNGACLPHLAILCDLAPKKLGSSDLRQFYDIMFAAQTRYMREIEADLDWFTKKFDYRNQDEPWGNAKDAIERAIQNICGKNIN